ncbi:hypothetical protein [Alicyclobacillus fodiniaquatilis]|uniref:Uncharacterized protein n=1 Tax=Alicyclobacillus fodiniaquatilis TaxID=1661150 RepID=A0ABW4JHG0_9BACL
MDIDLICADMAHPIAGARVYERKPDMPNIERFASGISAWIPTYHAGHASLIALANGERWYVPKSAKSIYMALARLHCVNLRHLRHVYEAHLRRSIYLPLVVGAQMRAYAPLKVRTPLTRNDGAMGYFRVDHVAAVRVKNRDVCFIEIHSGDVFEIQMPKLHVEQRLRDADSLCVLMRHRGE